MLDKFLDKLAPSSKWKERGGALVSECKSGSETLLLVKPQTFMNRSGEPVQELMHFYKLGTSNLLVVHDELDLDVGTIRLKKGGGEGGHNGLRSLTEQLGGGDYIRLRVGIGHPRRLLPQEGKGVFQGDVSDWVLGRFLSEELPVLEKSLELAVETVEEVISKGFGAAQQRVNTKPREEETK